MTKRVRHRVLHYDNPEMWDVNICGVYGTWSATSDIKKVTCTRCRRHLTWWVKKALKGQRQGKVL